MIEVGNTVYFEREGKTERMVVDRINDHPEGAFYYGKLDGHDYAVMHCDVKYSMWGGPSFDGDSALERRFEENYQKKQAREATTERVKEFLQAPGVDFTDPRSIPGMAWWSGDNGDITRLGPTKDITAELEKLTLSESAFDNYDNSPGKSFTASDAYAMASSFRDTPWVLEQLQTMEQDRLIRIENTAWQLFCTEPAVKEFCLRVSEGRDHEPVLGKMWERDENGWRTAATARANLMEMF